MSSPCHVEKLCCFVNAIHHFKQIRLISINLGGVTRYGRSNLNVQRANNFSRNITDLCMYAANFINNRDWEGCLMCVLNVFIDVITFYSLILLLEYNEILVFYQQFLKITSYTYSTSTMEYILICIFEYTCTFSVVDASMERYVTALSHLVSQQELP